MQLLYEVLLYSSSGYFITFQGASGNLDNKNLNFLFIISSDNTVKNESMAWDVCLLTCRLQCLSFWTVKRSVLSSSPYEDFGSLEIMNFKFLVNLSADITVKIRPWLENLKGVLSKWIDWYQFRPTSVFSRQYLSVLPEERVSSVEKIYFLPLPWFALFAYGIEEMVENSGAHYYTHSLWFFLVQVYNSNCRSLSLLSPRFLQQN